MKLMLRTCSFEPIKEDIQEVTIYKFIFSLHFVNYFFYSKNVRKFRFFSHVSPSWVQIGFSVDGGIVLFRGRFRLNKKLFRPKTREQCLQHSKWARRFHRRSHLFASSLINQLEGRERSEREFEVLL